jgi:hypothetical protein
MDCCEDLELFGTHLWASIPQLVLFHDFPVGILAGNFPFAKGVEVAAPYFDALSITTGSGERPFRDAGVGAAIDKVLLVAIVNIGQALEARG